MPQTQQRHSPLGVSKSRTSQKRGEPRHLTSAHQPGHAEADLEGDAIMASCPVGSSAATGCTMHRRMGPEKALLVAPATENSGRTRQHQANFTALQALRCRERRNRYSPAPPKPCFTFCGTPLAGGLSRGETSTFPPKCQRIFAGKGTAQICICQIISTGGQRFS